MYEQDIPQEGFPLLNKTNRYSKSFLFLANKSKTDFHSQREGYELNFYYHSAAQMPVSDSRRLVKRQSDVFVKQSCW